MDVKTGAQQRPRLEYSACHETAATGALILLAQGVGVVTALCANPHAVERATAINLRFLNGNAATAEYIGKTLLQVDRALLGTITRGHRSDLNRER